MKTLSFIMFHYVDCFTMGHDDLFTRKLHVVTKRSHVAYSVTESEGLPVHELGVCQYYVG